MFENKDYHREAFSYPSKSPGPSKAVIMAIAMFFVILIAGGALYLSKSNPLAVSGADIVEDNRIEAPAIELESVDSDGDGLSDADEFFYGTNVNRADTDNDGYSDLQEINGGFNPLGEGKLLIKKREEEIDSKKEIGQVASYQSNTKNVLNNPVLFLQNKVKGYLNIGSMIMLFVRLLFFIVTIAIFAFILRFVLNKFFHINADFETALTIATLQTLSHTFIDYAAGVVLFFTGSSLLSLPLSLFSIILSFFMYNYILKSFLKTTTAQNVGIIIVTGLTMILVTFIITIILGIVLMPIMMIASALFRF